MIEIISSSRKILISSGIIYLDTLVRVIIAIYLAFGEAF